MRLVAAAAAALALLGPGIANAQQQQTAEPAVVPNQGAAAMQPVQQPQQPQIYAQQPPPAVAPGPVYVQPSPFYIQGPRTLPYDEGQPIPPGYTRREKPRLGLIIGGAVTLGVSYLLSLMAFVIDDSVSCVDDFGDGSCDDGSDLWPLAIPVAGPFLTIGTTDGEQDSLTILLLDGIAQVGGVVMLVLGVTSKKTVLVRNDLAEVHLAPVALSGGGHGLGLAGHF